MKKEILDYMREHRNPFVFLLFALTAQITIVAVKWGKPLIWDSNVYVGMGKVIFSAGQYGLWESFRPLVLPMISGFSWFLGLPMTNFPRLIAVLISVTGIFVFYRIISDFTDRDTAFTAMMVLASFFIYVKYSSFFLTGIPASLLVVSSVYLVWKEKYFFGGILASLAFLTRFPAALVGPAVIVFLAVKAYRSGKYQEFVESSARYGGGVLLLAVPFMIINQIFYGHPLHPVISGAVIPTGNPDKYLLGAWFLVESFIQNRYLVTTALVLTPFGMYYSIKQDFEKNLLLALTLLVFYGFFSFYPHKELRFMLAFLPFFAYFSTVAVHKAAAHERIPERKAVWIFRIAVILFFLVSSIQIIGANTWQNTDRREFLDESTVMSGTVVSNTPEVVPYSDHKYIPVRPENLDNSSESISINSCTSEKDTGFCKAQQDEIDYVAINSCSWYCTPAIDNCQAKIDGFSSQLEKDFEEKVNITGSSCEYRIYEAR